MLSIQQFLRPPDSTDINVSLMAGVTDVWSIHLMSAWIFIAIRGIVVDITLKKVVEWPSRIYCDHQNIAQTSPFWNTRNWPPCLCRHETWVPLAWMSENWSKNPSEARKPERLIPFSFADQMLENVMLKMLCFHMQCILYITCAQQIWRVNVKIF